MTPKILVASAGTGKTTALLNILEELLEHTPPERIIYTTYTNAGANEAIDRACKRFPSVLPEQFKHFRTLHSLCYRNAPQRPMLGKLDYDELSEILGYKISGFSGFSANSGAALVQMSRGNRLLSLENLRRNALLSFEEVCQRQPNLAESPQVLRHFSETYREFKRITGKIDFGDQLENFLKAGRTLDVDYLIVDEAQDLSKLQWRILELLSEVVKGMYIAGDDKQAIYEFSGACPDSLINRKGDREVLETCHRLPRAILNYAEKIAERIQSKSAYTVGAQPDASEGTIKDIMYLDELDMSKGNWLIIARNRCFLEAIEDSLKSRGLLFKSLSNSALPDNLVECIKAWEQLDKGEAILAREAKLIYRNFLKTGTKVEKGFKNVLDSINDGEMLDYQQLKDDFGLITAEPWWEAFSIDTRLAVKLMNLDGGVEAADRIEVTTIHATKGREADNVVVLPDMAWTTWKEYEENPDAEHRTFYVACTRAKKNLFLMEPLTQNYYSFPSI